MAGTEPCLLTYLPEGHSLSTGWHGSAVAGRCLGGARTPCRVAGDHWLCPSPPCVTAGPQGDMLSPGPEFSWTQLWYKHKLYFHSMLGDLSPSVLSAGGTVRGTVRGTSHGTHPTAQPLEQPSAQPCSARRASLVPSPQARDVPQCTKGSHSIRPLAVAVMCHPVPWCR